MSVKTAGVGHFTIPTAPAAGTSCTSGAANTFTTNYVQLIASTSAALYITGVHLESAAALAATYIILQLATGGAGAESIVGQYLVPLWTGSTVALGFRPVFPPIPVAASTRIACKTADSVGSKATLVTLECIAQSNVVDDGITVGTVNLVNTTTTVTNQLTAAQVATGVWQDATAGDFTTASSIGKALYVSNVAPGGSGGHMISGTNAGTTTLGALTVTGAISNNGVTDVAQTGDSFAVVKSGGTGDAAAIKAKTDNLPASPASTTNITAGTITTVTNVTNAPTAGDFTAAMKTSLNAATPASVVGAVGSVTGNVGGNVTGSVGSVVGLTASNLDAAVSSRLAGAAYTAPDNTSLTAIKAKTDSLAFTVAGKVDANAKAVNDITVTGSGTPADPWGP